MRWGVDMCCMLYCVLQPMKTGYGKHNVFFLLFKTLMGPPPSHAGRIACRPRAGSYTMTYFAYALIRPLL
jgi:hypothetical protein